MTTSVTAKMQLREPWQLCTMCYATMIPPGLIVTKEWTFPAGAFTSQHQESPVLFSAATHIFDTTRRLPLRALAQHQAQYADLTV